MSIARETDSVVIAARDLRYAYGQGELRQEVLHGVSVVFRAGEIVLLTGPSGSGKTTFLCLVGALRKMQTGSLTVLGQELADAGPDELVATRRGFGFIFQMHNLISCLTVRENVQMALGCDEAVSGEEARHRAEEILSAVGLAGHAGKYPAQLSGGQRQRVGVARALVRRPRVILADEPTASLDERTGREILELLRRLAREQGCAVIIVTHDHRIFDIADRVMVIDDGRLEEAHVGLLRIAAQLTRAAELLPGYFSPTVFPFPAALRQNWAEALRQPARELAAWTQRSSSAWEKEATIILERWLASLQGLEAAQAEFLAEWHRETQPGLADLRDAAYQALETHVITLVEQMREPDEAVLAMLASATRAGGDFARHYARTHGAATLSGVELEALMRFVSVLAQPIYFLRTLGDCVAQWRDLCEGRKEV